MFAKASDLRRRRMIYVVAMQAGDSARTFDAVDAWIRASFESWTNPIENVWVV